MSLQEYTDPVILDTTGQAIVTKLNELKQVVQPVNPCTDIDISLPTTGWSGNGPYTYTYSNEHITSGCSVKANFLDGNSAGAVLYLNYEKVTGGVQFTADSVPTATIPIRLHILNADATSTAATTADQVSTDVISGASNVEEALGVVDGRVDTLNGKIAQIVAANAGSHNSIYRGKYLGSAVTSAQWAQIKTGTFDDLFIGDYWTINSVNWRIAGFNYWYNTGDTNCTKNHVVIVPDSNLASAKMNDANITTGAYVGSDFYTGNNSNTGKATAVTAVNNAFGSAHILSHRELLANATSNGAPSSWAWYDSTVELMNEQMVYGSRAWGNQAGAGNGYDVGIDKSQLPLFQHDHSRISNRAGWWLRGVVSGSSFACVYYSGYTGYDLASDSFGVRPAFGIFQS